MRLNVNSNLGCSVAELSGMSGFLEMGGREDLNPYSRRDFNRFKEYIKDRTGGIVIWADIVRISKLNLDFQKPNKNSGETLYKLLLDRGEHVQRSRQYKSESSGNHLRLYTWFIHQKPRRRSTKKARGKKVAKKA